jgi:hypothetical protein
MKLFGKILLSLLLLILLVAGAALTVWQKPSLVLTDSRVNRLFDQYAGSYFAKRPETLKLTLDPYGFTGKKLSLSASGFCLKEPDACFKEVKIELAFKFLKPTRIKMKEIGPVEILNESFTYTVPIPEKNPTPSPTPNPSHFKITDHVEMPTSLLVKDLRIEFPKIKIENGKEIIEGSFNATGKESDKMDLVVKAASNEGMDGLLELHTSFVLNQKNPFQSKVHFKQGKGSVDGHLVGDVEWAKLDGSIEGDLSIKKFIPWIHTLYVKNLKIDRAEKIRIRADLETKLDQELSFDHSTSVLPKVILDTNLRGKIEATTDKATVDYKIDLGPMNEKGIQLLTKAEGEFPFPKGKEYKYGIERFYLSLQIPVFQTLVENLKRTNYAIPAPFSTLKGNVSLKIGQENGEITQDTVPVAFTTNLDSTEQTVKTQSEAKIIFAPNPKKLKIVGQSKIESFRLTLPDLKVLEPTPLVKTDLRIISPHQEKKAEAEIKRKETGIEEPSPIDLEWKITTAPSGIRIYHPILKPYAPIEASWTIGNEREGSIELEPFEIEYLNRVAKVKTLRFYQKAGDPKFHYEGKIIIVKTDYTVFLDIVQDGEKPKVVFSSEPPLEQGDIISVLLFNQTSAELDTDQTSSVASTQSAVTSRALGLFSILALSSTPVEAVNFNPATGIYSARVKLANGLTATVGTDWDKTQEVALRKRLGKNFVLSTILQSDPETNSETRKTLIEWFKRF